MALKNLVGQSKYFEFLNISVIKISGLKLENLETFVSRTRRSREHFAAAGLIGERTKYLKNKKMSLMTIRI